MADSIGYLYTIGGYAALFGFGYILWQVSTRKSRKRVGTAPTSVKPAKPAPPPETRKEEKKKKQRLETFVSDVQEPPAKASKPKPKPKAAEEPKPAEPKASRKEDRDDEMDNREFARQLAKAQEGHKLTSNGEGSKHREKSVKQSRANKIKVPAEEKPGKPVIPEVQSAPSSNGADADDDASPANSPESRPFDVSGVSDMLEPAAAGPSILRLTDTSSKKQKKAAKAPEPVETKKQRQNRKKAEAAKAAREEAEKERKILEENQRRTARIAEGRPAKDGSEFTNGAKGMQSSWTHIGRNGAEVKKMEDSTLYEPLDTMESPAADAGVKPESFWISALPSEERQMEMLREESDEWSTVQTKSSRKARKAASAADSGDENKTSQAAAQPKQATTASTVKATKAAPPKTFGAFSALTVKEDFPDDLEEEWEV
ncbi:hypothetical protein ESCO_000999 [Escovopsis weberi]|uniref:Uncharacterized protein n=1 Tax=Escovopsis weberi TaxID=150374 RepID=A0A0N0RTC5_ESCWE|nr:hypothetical protein ESCO_000999 [Escovopsis weberi]